MGNIIVSEFITLDGVIEAPGGEALWESSLAGPSDSAGQGQAPLPRRQPE